MSNNFYAMIQLPSRFQANVPFLYTPETENKLNKLKALLFTLIFFCKKRFYLKTVFLNCNENVTSANLTSEMGIHEHETSNTNFVLSNNLTNPKEELDSLRLKNPNQLICAHLNINSVRNKLIC